MMSKRKTFSVVLRKAIAVSLVGLYVVFSIGILKASHFCMGREASVKFFTADAKKCPCGLFAKEKSDCCHDEHDLLKIDDEQKTISTLSLPLPIWKLDRLYTNQLITRVEVYRESDHVNEADASPPPKVPLFKSHCSYVFYDEDHIV